jgi:hypothetical protein
MNPLRRMAFPLLTLPIVGAIAACGAVDGTEDPSSSEEAIEQGAKHFDVNDIGGVFGRTATGDTFPSMPIGSTTTSDGQPLLPQAIFDQVLAFGDSMQIEGVGTTRMASSRVKNIAAWKITGWRFDPCAANPLDMSAHGGKPALSILEGKTRAEAKAILDFPGCFVQLRLIAQPLLNNRDEDFTMHLVFNVDAGNTLGVRDQIIGDLLSLKKLAVDSGTQTTGAPLGVHPALAKGDARFASTFMAFLQKHLVFRKDPVTVNVGGRQIPIPIGLTAVAFMGLENFGFEPWTFYAGRVVNGAWVADNIPVFGARNVKVQTFRQISPIGVFPRPPAEIPNTAPLFDPQSTDPTNPVTNGDAVHAVNNPEETNFFTTDCVSCHTSTQRLVGLKLPTTSSKRYQVPSGLTGFVAGPDLQGSSWNVRNCGYFGGKPAVSLRTANESAEAADAINKVIIPGLVQGALARNPGDNCSSQAVFDCFIAGNDATQCKSLCQSLVDTPDESGPVDSIAALPECKNREAATREPGNPTGNAPATSRTLASKRLAVRISVSDAACLSRVLKGSFTAKQKAERPGGGGALPMIEIRCTTASRCDAFFNTAANAPGAITLDANDSKTLAAFFTTSDKKFTTVNNGGSFGQGSLGLTVDCSSPQACNVAPFVR